MFSVRVAYLSTDSCAYIKTHASTNSPADTSANIRINSSAYTETDAIGNAIASTYGGADCNAYFCACSYIEAIIRAHGVVAWMCLWTSHMGNQFQIKSRL